MYDSRDNCNAIIETASNTIIVGCKATTIPQSITSIADSAFYKCSELTSISIPNSIVSIGSSAFMECSGLNDVSVEVTDPSVISMGDDVFRLSQANYFNRGLYVPVGSITTYQTDTKWKPYFGTIVEIGSTPVFAQIFEIGNLQYSITSDTTVSVTKYLSHSSSDIEIPSSVAYQNVSYIVPLSAIGLFIIVTSLVQLFLKLLFL